MQNDLQILALPACSIIPGNGDEDILCAGAIDFIHIGGYERLALADYVNLGAYQAVVVCIALLQEGAIRFHGGHIDRHEIELYLIAGEQRCLGDILRKMPLSLSGFGMMLRDSGSVGS